MIENNYSCFICGSEMFDDEFLGKPVDNHNFVSCGNCGVVIARPMNSDNKMDYSNYGDYLVNDINISEQIKTAKKFYLYI